jgi:hypothetical protein
VGSEQFFLEVVLRELVAMGLDSTLVHTHDRVLRALGFIAATSGVKMRFALAGIMPAVQNMLSLSSQALRPAKLKELGTLVGVLGVYMTQFYPAIFTQLLEFWLPTAVVCFGFEFLKCFT